MGGIIGAAAAPNWSAKRPDLTTQEQSDYDDVRFTPEGQIASASDKQAGGQSAVRIFWLTLLALVGVVMLAGPLVVNDNAGVGLLGAAAVILLGLPALQLVAVVVTLIILASSGRENVGLEYRQVGRIAVGTFVGSLIGILIMGGFGLLLTQR